jgi:hypothetical protein
MRGGGLVAKVLVAKVLVAKVRYGNALGREDMREASL